MRFLLLSILSVVLAAVAACNEPARDGQRNDPTVESILREPDDQGSVYDLRMDSMPDDGCVKMKINGVGGYLARVFCDSNYLHYQAAQALGIEPIAGVGSLRSPRRPLVKIASCREYYVDDLTHSFPFLVPEAARLLKEIGSRFNDSLQARGGGSYRLKVTSVLRTPRTVSRLRRINRNATDSSAHQFATTFDISYAKFICDSITVNRTQEDLKNLLGEVMFTIRNEGKCYVKYERKQGCFHITARPPQGNPSP